MDIRGTDNIKPISGGVTHRFMSDWLSSGVSAGSYTLIQCIMPHSSKAQESILLCFKVQVIGVIFTGVVCAFAGRSDDQMANEERRGNLEPVGASPSRAGVTEVSSLIGGHLRVCSAEMLADPKSTMVFERWHLSSKLRQLKVFLMEGDGKRNVWGT